MIVKAFAYTLIAVLLALFCVVGALFDMHFGTVYIELLFKTAVIAGMFCYAMVRKEIYMLWQGNYFTLFLIFALIPAVFNILATAGFADSSPPAATIAVTVLNIFITAVWEELYFRFVGKSLFEKNGGYTPPVFIFLAAVFALSHLVNLLFYSAGNVFLKTVVAFTTSVFMMALYRNTQNIFVTITSHFFMNLAAELTMLYVSDPANRLFAGFDLLPITLNAVFMLAAGLVIFIKCGYLVYKKNIQK